ncbi:hypothetical protein VINI7043_24687 [Vibrio nigripulchritudo ATCC 27043]|uniref:Chemotaxis protein n=1 Tax=Vibrio nigripulchritudo TaxID=28173 RepID=U4K306_9VIBR|nr:MULTISPECIES: DUF3379 domain-containing protein [Vibrio]EGU54332.1 hypothetical protein VINI7043_24687 [Vibrio nigripulchritudo ATCC 27043]KJY80257.1 chemotaxis protein [Vibrio nigripulchritudo]UAB71285.1 DUF3379 domain-containing protein [Vibrio sp. SCSIO 43132]CCN36062.1 conserved hypothetical protein [Vibrio nigripulchritudo AM115]CCN44342.1 conserved hypothetical protein [Vibrio nigripulchritudo FTn2]
MDDLEFRRRIMSDPKDRDDEIEMAISENSANGKFVDDILSLDAQIEKAMKVDVPDGLADRILFNQSAETEQPKFAKKALAMAASVAFAFGLLVGQVNWGGLVVTPAYATLANTALAHVTAEKPFINPIDENVSSTQINVKMKPFAYHFSQNFPYHVYYLNHCGFGKSNAMHMVFEGEHGRVTLFVTNIPAPKSEKFVKDGMSGIVMPLMDASMVIVGSMDEDVEKIAETLKPIIHPAS